MSYEKDVHDLMKYGLSKQVAQEVCSSHSQHEVSTILDFLHNYSFTLKPKSK